MIVIYWSMTRYMATTFERYLQAYNMTYRAGFKESNSGLIKSNVDVQLQLSFENDDNTNYMAGCVRLLNEKSTI